MARDFVMGARITLNDMFSNPMRDVIRATNNFRNDISNADRAADRYYDSMGRLREANGRFARSTQDSTDELRQQQGAMERMKGTVFSLQNAFIALGGAMAVKGAYNWLVGSNADMEQYQNTLTVVLGSQEKAVEQMAWAEKFAAKTPFEIPGIIEATTRLESYGIESKKVLGITGDMASVMGKDLMQAVEAVADAQTGELERLKEFGITKKMLEEQAKLMGSNPVNNKGQITDQEAFNAALFALMEKRFKGGMEMQSKSFKGMLSNASDFMGRIGRQLGKPLFDNMKEGLQGLLGFLGRLEESGAVDRFIKNVQTGFSKVGSFIGEVIKPFKALYDMMLGSGNMDYFINLFGVEGAIGFNNILWDIVDAVKGVWNFATGTLFPALKTGFGIAVNAARDLASWILSQYFAVQKYVPYIQGLVIAFAAYYAVVKTVAAVTRIWAAAQALFNAVMAINPIFLVIIAIGLLIGWIIKASGGWDVFREKLAVLWAYMVNAWKNIWATIQPILQQIGQVIVNTWNWVIATVPPILMQLWQQAIQWFTAIWNAISPLLTTIWTGIVNVFNAIKAFWNQWGGLITAAFQVYLAGWLAIFKAVLTTIWTVVKGIFSWIKEIISGTFKIISGIVQVGWSIISGIFSTALNLLSGNWSGAWDSMLGMLEGVWSGIKDFFGGLKDLFFDSGAAIIKTLVDGIKSMAMAPVNAVKDMLGKVRDFLPFSDAKTGPLSQLTHNGGKIVTTMAEGVQSKAGTLHNAMNKTLNGVPTSVTGTANVNAAGSSPAAGNGGRTISIRNLVEKIIISGAEGKDGKALADEIIEALYEKLQGADDILGGGDMGALL